MRASLPLLVIAGCGPGGEDLELLPYPTTPVDWSPSPDAVCGVDTPLGSVLLGPWDDAGIGGAAAAGDLDGDGLADLALTVHAAETVLTAGFRVYRGVAGGVEDEAWVGVMGPPETQLGASLAPLGDVDGDGVGDLAVGVQTFETEPSPASVELWLGGAAGLTPASWSAPGLSVAGIDADADGLGDVVVGDVTARQVSLYLGRPGGPSTTFDAISGGDSGFGREVGPAGDLDGDGREEA
ncbi:MAG: VCBS repeat-containing protein, partial [Myxococcota bacterium]